MAKQSTRHTIKRELTRASVNADWIMKHLIRVRNLCHEGHRDDLLPLVDKIGEGAIALQQTLEGFRDGIDGKIPMTEADLDKKGP